MFYKMFDLILEINPKYEFTEHLLNEYKTYDIDDVDIDIKIDIPYEEIKKESENDVNFSMEYHEMVCIFRHITEKILDFNGVFVHSAVVMVDGEGYMFCGKSGTGKTTHVLEWTKYFGDKAVIINADKPILRYIDNSFIAYGNPWCGKENLGKNDKVKINAISFIEQSEFNEIKKIDSLSAFKKLLNQTVIPKNPKRKLIHYELVDKLVNDIPFYNLKCNISKDAVIKAYTTMKEK